MAQQVRDLVLSLQGLGHCCGVGLIPGPGTASCHRCGQKKKEKKRKKMSGTDKIGAKVNRMTGLRNPGVPFMPEKSGKAS